MTSIKEKISFCREHGIKVNEIAGKLGISRQFLQQVSSGKRKMPTSKMQEFDKLLASFAPINVTGSTVSGGIICHNGSVRETAQEYDKHEALLSRIEAIETDLALLKKMMLK